MRFSIAMILVSGLALVSGSAQAMLITEYSGDGGDVLVSSVDPGSVTTITPHPVWGDVSDDAGLASGTADWISYTNTGYPVGSNTLAPNTTDRTDLNEATAHFRRTFSLGGTGDLALWILADDTAAVELTGPGGMQTIASSFLGQLDPCAPGGSGQPIGCVEADMGVFSLSGLALGDYSLDIYAFQTNGDVFGTQYAYRYTSVDASTMLGLLGIGMAAIGLARKKKKSS
jgi:hypothetical protein